MDLVHRCQQQTCTWTFYLNRKNL